MEKAVKMVGQTRLLRIEAGQMIHRRQPCFRRIDRLSLLGGMLDRQNNGVSLLLALKV
ncbi:MAG: hypothetical protein HC789_06420 [Microcoleus sp. CSU_2_2]|nr:hypothetical protein [Microcoleus sp. CSU_2_2]